MGVGDGMGVAVAVGIGVKVGGMREGVVVGVGGARTAVQAVRNTRNVQSVKRKIVDRGCWRIGTILPSESVLKIMAKTLTQISLPAAKRIEPRRHKGTQKRL
jgi:hypothetical protein